MDTIDQVEKFLRDIRRRNRREIILNGILVLVLGVFAATAPVSSFTFFGYLLFILGIMWFVASPRGDLSGHPASNVDYWAAEMLRQAKLLRRIPVWGFGPFAPALVLLLWPRHEVDLKDVLAISFSIAVIMLVFAVVAWLNLRGASKLTLEAPRRFNHGHDRPN